MGGGRWRCRRVEGRWLWRKGGGCGGTEVSVEGGGKVCAQKDTSLQAPVPDLQS